MKYISNHSDHESFSSLTDFKSQLNINDIIKNERKESLQLLEMVIFISGISSNKEHLDLLEGCNENCISLYLSITEKYMQKYEMTQPDERSSVTRKMNDGYKANDELYKELDEKTNLVNNLTKAKCELEINYKEVCDKLKNIQISNESVNQLQEELIKEKTKSNRIQSEFEEYKIISESKYKEAEEKIKTLTFKFNLTNDKLLSSESKLESYKQLSSENERLKTKLKGLSLLKDKEDYIEQLQKDLEGKKKIIDVLVSDKENLNAKIIQLTSDISAEQDKVRKNQQIQRQLENDIEQLKVENKRIDDLLKKDTISRASILSAQNNNNDTKASTGINLGILGQENFESEIDELHTQIAELKIQVNKYKETITQITNEKNILQSEKDSLYFEKEKTSNELQRIELEKQKIEIEYEGKIKQLQTEILQYKTENSTITSSINDKTSSESTEISNLKSQLAKKDELIKALQNKLDNRSDSDDFINNLEDNDNIAKKEKNNTSEIEKITNELNTYKKNEDDLKLQITREHELISSSFYELALQFVRLKEANDVTSAQNQSKTWLELERRKNFPN